MNRNGDTEYLVLSPDLQIAFYHRLEEIRTLYLADALRDTVLALDLEKVDSQLSKYVEKKVLSTIASFGLRGEVIVPVPCLLEENPRLLGYYRLLYGITLVQNRFFLDSGLRAEPT